jgi:hypothetical protein
MKVLVILYLLFIITYEHWGDQSVTSKIIYFSFQYLWMAILSLYQFRKVKELAYIFAAVIFVGLVVNELLCLGFEQATYTETVNGQTPVFGLTVICLALFTIHEIIQWKKRSV